MSAVDTLEFGENLNTHALLGASSIVEQGAGGIVEVLGYQSKSSIRVSEGIEQQISFQHPLGVLRFFTPNIPRDGVEPIILFPPTSGVDVGFYSDSVNNLLKLGFEVYVGDRFPGEDLGENSNPTLQNEIEFFRGAIQSVGTKASVMLLCEANLVGLPSILIHELSNVTKIACIAAPLFPDDSPSSTSMTVQKMSPDIVRSFSITSSFGISYIPGGASTSLFAMSEIPMQIFDILSLNFSSLVDNIFQNQRLLPAGIPIDSYLEKQMNFSAPFMLQQEFELGEKKYNLRQLVAQNSPMIYVFDGGNPDSVTGGQSIGIADKYNCTGFGGVYDLGLSHMSMVNISPSTAFKIVSSLYPKIDFDN